MIKKVLIFFISVLLFSCSNVGHIRTNDNSVVYKSSNPDKIEVYSTSNLTKPYVILGEVIADADSGEDAENSVEKLKREAAKIGADALINLRLSISYGYWSSGIKATGTAVKFK